MEENPWLRRYRPKIDFIHTGIIELRDDIDKRKEHLTKYTMTWGEKVVDKAWKLGDFLWTKYDEKF